MSNSIEITGNIDQESEQFSRFWAKVDKRGPDECWHWMGARQSGKWPYGRLTVAGRWMAAHVLSWEIANGQHRPSGLVVRHTCDNPPCVNPGHLQLGTFADNTRDMHERGRGGYTGQPGLRHPAVKITPDIVALIRADRSAGMSWAALGDKYGISKAHARRVALGINWKETAA